MVDLHHQSVESETINQTEVRRNTRYGLVLFAVYSLLYGSFVLVNAFAPSLMEATVLGGVNLAVLSGLGLIAAAFLLALVYAWLCRAANVPVDEKPEELK